MQPDLTVSIISADNLNLLLPCLRSVFECTHRVTLEVYLVDNASSDGTAEAVKGAFPQVQIIRNDQRRGFSTNNNMVLRQGQGRYLMLLNDDTQVLDGALDRLVEFMDANPQAGVVGSSLLNGDGSRQLAFAYFPHPLIEGWWPSVSKLPALLKPKARPFEVDSVSGAAMVVRREVVEQVGVLDTAFDPIYSEEIDWCYRIRRAGWRIYTLPQAQIVHYGSQTMNRAVPHKYELLLSHKMLFFRKHAGSMAVRLYRIALIISTFSKLLWWTISKDPDKKQLHSHLLKRIRSL